MGELRHLLELAHSVARADARRLTGAPVPEGLARLLDLDRLPPAGFVAVRAALDDDHGFREQVALLADEREVGEVAWLWVTRPEGWLNQIHRLRADETGHEAKLEELKAHSETLKSELTSVTAKLVLSETALAKERTSAAELGQLVELAESENEARRVRAVELEQRATRAERLLGDERVAHKRTAATLAAATASTASADGDATVGSDAAESENSESSAPPAAQLKRRRPHRSARGVLDDSPAGVDELIRVPNMRMLVDGYNVTKTGWPNADLYTQRERLMSSMAARLGGRLVADIVFDGADVVGGGRSPLQSQVRVTWSPAGVTADDVLLTMLDRIDQAVPVVVVSTDGEVRDGARERGANVVSSWSFYNWLN